MSTAIAILLVAAHIISTTTAAPFTCNATATATCAALIEYVPANATTYARVESLFQVAHLQLLAANNLPTSTPSTRSIRPGSTTRIPFPCVCANGTGISNKTPLYTVKSGDGLDAIARSIFMGLVNFTEIQVANGLPDPNKIFPGEKLSIPLPCSCDPVGGSKVVHLGHVVASGSSVAGIAAEFGTDEQTLLQLNGIADPKDLLAGEVLDVPLSACSSSSISSASLDFNLLVPNGSYALTANDCILCRCNSSQLVCQSTQVSKTCPQPKCGSLYIGNTTSSGCNVTTCMYGGYTNATGLSILTNTTTQSTCSNGGGPARFGLKESRWNFVLFFFLHAATICYWFL